MADILMALGDYRFSLSSAAYKELSRTSAWRWTKQERMGRKPARHFTGPDSDSITLAGTIYPHYWGGLGQINEMRRQADTGKPLILVDGTGRVWGKWCVVKVTERQSNFLPNGVPLKMDFDLTLEEFGPDDEVTA
jgi:phage protein U